MNGVQYSFDAATGEILSVTTGKLDGVWLNHAGGVAVDTHGFVDSDKHYHKDGAIADRPVIAIPDMGSVGVPVMLGHIPSHSRILINDDPVGVTDGTDLELTFDLDGEYEVAIDLPFPWVPIKTTITVKP